MHMSGSDWTRFPAAGSGMTRCCESFSVDAGSSSLDRGGCIGTGHIVVYGMIATDTGSVADGS